MITITGVGLVTCLGNNSFQNFINFQKGICGIQKIQKFDTHNYHLKKAYEITNYSKSNCIKSWIITTITEALSESGDVIDNNTIIVIGTGLRNIRSYEESIISGKSFFYEDLDFKKFLVDEFPKVKDVISLSNACSSSLYALSLGLDLLNLQLADKVVIVGADCISMAMHALDDRVSSSKPQVIKSFDKNRSGVLLGEGAAAIILKNNIYEADEANDKIYIKPIALSCDAFHETQPCSQMIEKTIRNAINKANLSPHDVDIVFTHGTGTILNDVSEGKAISAVFYDCNTSTFITGLKPMIGHTSGASGLMSLIAGYMSLKKNVIIPFVNLKQPIDEIENMQFVDFSIPKKLNVAEINAFGFGGLNAVAIIGK